MNGLGDEAGVRLGESLGTRGAGANGNQGSFLNLQVGFGARSRFWFRSRSCFCFAPAAYHYFYYCNNLEWLVVLESFSLVLLYLGTSTARTTWVLLYLATHSTTTKSHHSKSTITWLN